MDIHSDRRHFLKTLGGGLIGGALAGCHLAPSDSQTSSSPVPSYLEDYAALYKQNPRQAALKWFAEAKFGLFMHYGLYSLLGRGEWVMFKEQIPLAEYEKLKEQFTTEQFDADFITDLACSAGMKYVNITSRHHDSFCLFETKQNDYHSMASPAGRDLVGELADQCRKKKLGLFLYYSYGLDWRHPYYFPRRYAPMARPAYPFDEPRYLFKTDDDFRKYIDFTHAQLTELLTNYSPLAGIWLDPIMPYYARPDLFPVSETYALIRRLQPQALISFKQGASGDEDFAAPERSGHSLLEKVKKRYPDRPDSAAIAEKSWNLNQHKHNEICDTLQPKQWGYNKNDTDKHLTADEVFKRLQSANANNCNLLMNTGPLPDGSIDPVDAATLRRVGKMPVAL